MAVVMVKAEVSGDGAAASKFMAANESLQHT